MLREDGDVVGVGEHVSVRISWEGNVVKVQVEKRGRQDRALGNPVREAFGAGWSIVV